MTDFSTIRALLDQTGAVAVSTEDTAAMLDAIDLLRRRVTALNRLLAHHRTQRRPSAGLWRELDATKPAEGIMLTRDTKDRT